MMSPAWHRMRECVLFAFALFADSCAGVEDLSNGNSLCARLDIPISKVCDISPYVRRRVEYCTTHNLCEYDC